MPAKNRSAADLSHNPQKAVIVVCVCFFN